MSDRWLHDWFPVVGMLLQSLLWGLLTPRFLSSHHLANLTFTELPEDEDW